MNDQHEHPSRGRSDGVAPAHACRRRCLLRLSWIVGLSVFSSSTRVTSSGADVLRAIDGHAGIVALQYVLTEGIPAIALALVVLAVGRSARSTTVLAAGLGAAAVSLVQCGLGLYLTTLRGDAGTAGSLSAAINRLDGVKMLLLAGMALAAFVGMRRGRLALPSWLGYVALALAAAITVSGVGYLFLLDGPATAAWVSLPLLIAWMTGAGMTVRPRIDRPEITGTRQVL